MCPRHWRTLRPIIKSAIWREYRVGQEHDKKPSARYMAVQRRAIAELAFKPHDEQAARDATPYIISSERWRLIAIAKGEGDPLAGISKKPITPNEMANSGVDDDK